MAEKILKDRIVEGFALLYSDVIEGVVPQSSVPVDAEIIDANGEYVSPGLIDMHIHGYLGKDVCDGKEESIRTISRGLLQNGVTGYLPTTMTEDISVIENALSVCRGLKEESKAWQGAEILGVHAEGLFTSESKKGAQDAKYIKKPDAEFVKKYADIIKTITLAPEEDENDFAAIREIRRDTDVSCELIVDMVHVDKNLYNLLWKQKGRRLCFITDCLPAGGLPVGEYTLGGQKIFYDGTICRLSDGTIAGSVLHLNHGVWNVYKNSDIPLYECVNCASLNPATTLGIEKHKGSLETGKDADIVITDLNFEVVKTIISGETKYEA